MSDRPRRQDGFGGSDETDGAAEADFKPLSAEQARQWRLAHPQLSVWRIVIWQLATGLLVAMLAGGLGGLAQAWSAGYGSLAVVLPAALFARGLARRAGVAGAALAGFVGWELVKIALTVAMLAAAPVLVPQLSWLALLAGFVLTLKVYWVAMWLHPARRQ